LRLVQQLLVTTIISVLILVRFKTNNFSSYLVLVRKIILVLVNDSQ